MRENGERRATYALEVLSRILGQGRTSRFSRALVDERLALDVQARNWASRDPGLFSILVTVCPGVEPSSVIDDDRRGRSKHSAEHGPDAHELARAQNQIAVQRAFERDGTFALAQRLGEFEAVGSWHLDDDYVERIAGVSIDDVRDVVRTFLHEDNRTVGRLLPKTARTFDRVPVRTG